MKLTIKRSPARVAWWVMFNGAIISIKDTKKAAEAEITELMETDVWQSSMSVMK